MNGPAPTGVNCLFFAKLRLPQRVGPSGPLSHASKVYAFVRSTGVVGAQRYNKRRLR